MSGLCQSLAIQRRVIWALLMREVITRFGRENVGVLWIIAEPMTFTLGVTALWTAAGLNHGSSIPIVAFAITGYSSVLLWRNTVSRCNSGIQQNINLLYHRNVRVLDVFVTRILHHGHREPSNVGVSPPRNACPAVGQAPNVGRKRHR